MSSTGRFKLLSLFLALMLVAVGSVPIVERLTQGQQGGKLLVTIGSVASASGTADFVCDGVNDNVQFQLALNNLDATGGKILVVSSGTFNFGAGVTRAIPNVTIEGTGYGTYITGAASITAGGNSWKIVNLRFDNGGMAMGATTNWIWENVDDGGTRYTLRNPSYSLIGGAEVVGTSITDSGLTAGRVVYAGAAGLLSTDAGLTFDAATNALTVGTITDSALTASRVVFAGVGGLLSDDADLTFSGSTTTATNLNVTTTLGVGNINLTDSGADNRLLANNYALTRAATYTVAASNASAIEKAQADYVADGSNDEATIQTAIDYCIANKIPNLDLSSGKFNIQSLANVETIAGNVYWAGLEIPAEYADSTPVILRIHGSGTNYYWGEESLTGTILYLDDAAYGGIVAANSKISVLYISSKAGVLGDTETTVYLDGFSIMYDNQTFGAAIIEASAVNFVNGMVVDIGNFRATVEGVLPSVAPALLPETETVAIITPASNLPAFIKIHDTLVDYYYTAFYLQGDQVILDNNTTNFAYNYAMIDDKVAFYPPLIIRNAFNVGTPNGVQLTATFSNRLSLQIENYKIFTGMPAPFDGWNGSDDMGDGVGGKGKSYGSVTWSTTTDDTVDRRFWDTANASGVYSPEWKQGHQSYTNDEGARQTRTAFAPTSGVQYYNDTKHNGLYLLPITLNPTGAAAATIVVNVSNADSGGTVLSESLPIGADAGTVRTISFVVPAGWFYTVTVAESVIGNLNVQFLP